ncbi:hypothetical protein J4G33_04810 [Actinotalea sp. BY-33]|uniref:Uncharacterized protein n=1 Tax=Actinotalea soli TaxID=2819234 RepID=A0A939RTG6_9CELL|nr:hypothetical protein [Actinotalea soli]MBO1751119.1 hypothetical protein [Actinotalea soli]
MEAGSVLATPQEVAEMGGTARDVAHQAAAWKRLPEDVARAQLALNASERELAAAAFDNIVEPSPVTIMVSPQTCGGAYLHTYYKINSDNQAMQCFAGAAGTYTLTNKFGRDYGSTTIRLQPSRKGRVYYDISSTYYWSTTRGPNDSNWYRFSMNYDQNIMVHRVQLY